MEGNAYAGIRVILVDRRQGSTELAPIIKRIGVPVDVVELPYGDFAFDGQGPKGPISIGVERKTLHDLLNCIDDARYVMQKTGMAQLYDKSFLIVEGMWKPHDPEGWLMEGFQGGTSWGICRYRSQRTLYSKLRRYLFSVALSGVIVLYSRDIFQTAYDLTELYNYFSKKWTGHTSMVEVQKLAIPTLTGKPSLVLRWANNITDVGVKIAQDAERLFKNGRQMANASESDWLKLPGVGVKTAQQIVAEIGGWWRK